MGDKEQARTYAVISAILLAVTVAAFGIYYFNTKKNIESFNAALGKQGAPELQDVMNVILNDGKLGSFEENVRYTNAVFKDVIEIKDKMFIQQINDIYLNQDDYVGKPVKFEGIFKEEDTLHNRYYYVLRYGPGCCGNDGNVGFEVAWNKSASKKYPKDDDWVEAAGTLKVYEEDGYPYLYVELSSLRVMETRGVEYVR
ncbi:MAG: hypothetical protein LBD07_04190 [Spirochaetaceae bacterium]|jgi:hypothetical protein|nr:hypothetical protein [Spirochaetaceae bacterium]